MKSIVRPRAPYVARVSNPCLEKPLARLRVLRGKANVVSGGISCEWKSNARTYRLGFFHARAASGIHASPSTGWEPVPQGKSIPPTPPQADRALQVLATPPAPWNTLRGIRLR